MFDLVHFELKQYHVDLLTNANIDYVSGCEWGWLGLDCKRPFGNGDMTGDMAKIMGIEQIETDEGPQWPKGTHEKMVKIFEEELPIALEVILESKSFEPGVYEKEEYMGTWEPE